MMGVDWKDGRAFGLTVTAFIHLGVIGGVWGMSALDGRQAERRARLLSDEFTSIEAGLAIRQKSASGKKTKLPTKDVAPRMAARTDGFTLDPFADVDDDADKNDAPSDLDPESTFKKFRDPGTAGMPMGSGGDSDSSPGSVDGSDWGTLDEAKGHPYVGELVGRLTADFEVPTLVTETGLEAWGCVRLDAEGRIVERDVPAEHRSRSKTFNRAVAERLRKAPDMENAVPRDDPELYDLLVKRGICVTFRY